MTTELTKAAQTERDTGPRVLREVFALCEDTIDKMAGVNTEFSRGRAFEAKGISRAIGTWFQDEYCGQSHMGEPSLPAPQQATPASDAHELAYNMAQWREDARTHGSEHVPVHVTTIDKLVKHLRSIPAKQATPEPLIVKGAMAGMVDAQVRDLWPTKDATPEPVGEVRCEGCGYMTHHREHMGCVRAAKQYTRPAPGVPEGFALVPVEPEREMMEAMPSLPAIGAPGDMELKAKGWSLKAIQNRHRWLAALAAATTKGGK